MARFEARTSAPDSGRVVVSLAGECDLSAREELASALTAAVRSAPLTVVDLADLEFLDSSGMNGLVAAHRAAQQAGGRLCVVNATGMVADLLDLTGVGDLLAAPAASGDNPG